MLQLVSIGRKAGRKGLGGDNPLAGKKVYIPPMAYGSGRAFAAGFRALGVDAEITPPSDHRTRELGARYTSGDECYPAKVTVGDLEKLQFARSIESYAAKLSRNSRFSSTSIHELPWREREGAKCAATPPKAGSRPKDSNSISVCAPDTSPSRDRNRAV